MSQVKLLSLCFFMQRGLSVCAAKSPNSVFYALQVAANMLREEGFASFYNGLGPSLIGIAPYIAVNFCVFDL